jgi:hypothetical protein
VRGLAHDPTFHQNIHSGRMDSMAMLFILLGFYFLVRAGDGTRPSVVADSAASGLFAALGVLTTPRPGYLLIPMALILLVRWARRRDLTSTISVAVWGTVILVCFAAWILYAFGSIPAMLVLPTSQDFTSGGFGVRAPVCSLLAPPALLMLAARWSTAVAASLRPVLHGDGDREFITVKDKGVRRPVLVLHHPTHLSRTGLPAGAPARGDRERSRHSLDPVRHLRAPLPVQRRHLRGPHDARGHAVGGPEPRGDGCDRPGADPAGVEGRGRRQVLFRRPEG